MSCFGLPCCRIRLRSSQQLCCNISESGAAGVPAYLQREPPTVPPVGGGQHPVADETAEADALQPLDCDRRGSSVGLGTSRGLCSVRAECSRLVMTSAAPAPGRRWPCLPVQQPWLPTAVWCSPPPLRMRRCRVRTCAMQALTAARLQASQQCAIRRHPAGAGARAQGKGLPSSQAWAFCYLSGPQHWQ